jgi:hypothetical protein
MAMSHHAVRSLRHRTFIATLGATALLTALTAHAQLTTWELGGAALQYAASGPSWQDYGSADVGSDPLFDGIKLFGTGGGDTVFSLSGTDFMGEDTGDPDYRGSRLVIWGTGTIDGTAWTHPDHYISTTYGIGFDFDGGIIDFYDVSTGFTLFDADDNFLIGVGSGFFGGLGTFPPGGYGIGWEFQDRFGQSYETAESFYWSLTFAFDWTDMEPEDTFTFYVPHDSIDVRVLPEPTSAQLLALCGAPLLRRRR